MLCHTHKRLFVFLLPLFFSGIAKASGDTLYYFGKIIISKKVSYAYNLRFTVNAKSEITGYSLTDAGGVNETKVKISGFYDSLKNTLTFEEKNILRTKVDQKQNDLCFVKATLTYKYTNFLETFTGKFSGFTPGTGEACASGEIKLINARKGQNIRNKIDKFYSLPPAKDSSEKPVIAKPLTQTKKEKQKKLEVSDEKGIVLPFTGDSVRLTVWDNGKIDGDRISIMLNDTYLIQDYTLDSSKKMIFFPLTGNAVDTIKIIALNEGKIPPNTALVRVESPTESYPIEVRAAINEIRNIFLKKKNVPAIK